MAKNDTQAFPKELLDQLLCGRDPKTVLESEGLIGDLKKALAQRMLSAEMDVHLAQEAEAGLPNHRNGTSSKTVLTPQGSLELSIPRDRHGRFDPALIGKYRRRFPGFDDKIIALYARGVSPRDIQAHVRELYGIEISPDLVSAVTDAVIDEVSAWQARPLEACYALVFFDALRVKIRDEGLVKNKSVYLAIGMRASGHKEVLGLWIEHSEGAKFWLRVMNELRSRGTQDILIAVVDGLKGFPEAITTVFPDTVVQTCIVHLIRYSMQFASWKERKTIAAALKPVYQAPDAQGRCRGVGSVRSRPVGAQVPADRPELAAKLGGGDCVLRLLARGRQDHLHHQRDRIVECHGEKGGAQQRAFPERPGRDEVDLAGAAPGGGQVEQSAYFMACC